MFGKLELKKNISKQEIKDIIFNYIRYNHIYEAISQNKNISKTTIWKIINSLEFNNTYNDNLDPVKDIIYTDTVYIKWIWALTIFNSWYYRKPILWIWSKHEGKDIYIEWFRTLESKWWVIKWELLLILWDD